MDNLLIPVNDIDILQILRERASGYGKQKELAEEIGIKPAYLCDILKGRRNPGVPAVLAYLGIRRATIQYERI